MSGDVDLCPDFCNNFTITEANMENESMRMYRTAKDLHIISKGSTMKRVDSDEVQKTDDISSFNHFTIFKCQSSFTTYNSGNSQLKTKEKQLQKDDDSNHLLMKQTLVSRSANINQRTSHHSRIYMETVDLRKPPRHALNIKLHYQRDLSDDENMKCTLLDRETQPRSDIEIMNSSHMSVDNTNRQICLDDNSPNNSTLLNLKTGNDKCQSLRTMPSNEESNIYLSHRNIPTQKSVESITECLAHDLFKDCSKENKTKYFTYWKKNSSFVPFTRQVQKVNACNPPFLWVFTETARLNTFSTNNWSNRTFFPYFLAPAGFYYRGEGSVVHCYACHLKTDLNDWYENENPGQAHARLNPNCKHVTANGYKPMNLSQIVPILNKKNSSRKPTLDGALSSEMQKMQLMSENQKLETTQHDRKFLEITLDSSAGVLKSNVCDGYTYKAQDEQLNLEETHSICPEPKGHLSNVSREIKTSPITRSPHHFETFDAMNSQLTQDGIRSILPEFKYPQYQAYSARLRSYDKWLFSHKQSAKDLTEAGYFYTGENDIVRCFCCDLGLAEWDPKDNPWVEHARHNPNCWFLKTEKGEIFIENIQHDWKKIYNPKHTAYDDKLSRIATFDGWRDDIEQTAEVLADAGFFYTGEEDVVRCHYCDGGLRNWEPGDIPWEEHAKWFPFCKFVIKMKGRDYIEDIKRKAEERQILDNSITNTSPLQEMQDDTKERQATKDLRELGIDDVDIRFAMEEFKRREGNVNFSTEVFMSILFDEDVRHSKQKQTLIASSTHAFTEKPEEKDPKKLLEINRQLKEKTKCVRCRTSEITMLFVNCGHRITCEICAFKMDFCPVCDKKIKKRMKTFLS